MNQIIRKALFFVLVHIFLNFIAQSADAYTVSIDWVF